MKQTFCQICQREMKFKNLALKRVRVLSMICEDCFDDPRKTVSRCDVLLSGIDMNLLTKYYYKNYMMFSRDEFDKYHDNDKLDDKDILSFHESPHYYSKSKEFRYEVINKLCKLHGFDIIEVLSDKYVDAFIDLSLHSYNTDNEFFDSIIERFV